jgi:hypothetical protein
MELENYMLRMEEILHQFVGGLSHCNHMKLTVFHGAGFRNHPQ